MGSGAGEGPEDFFDDKGLETLFDDVSGGQPGEGGVSSSSTAGPTADEIIARVLPTIALDPKIGTMQSLA